MAASISTAPSAPAATPAPFSTTPIAASSASTAIKPRSRQAPIWSRQAQGRLTLIEDQFSNLDSVARDCGFEQVDGVVVDLGVSSMQLDRAERGFSFRLDGPLDMRMGKDGPSAADVVALASERDLADIIFQLGEERHSRGVARAIVKARAEAPIITTAALARIVGSVVRVEAERDPSGDAHVSGLAHFRQ